MSCTEYTTHHEGCACWEERRNEEIARLTKERDKAIGDAAQALTERIEWWKKGRREGAETMREAAAQLFDEEARAWGDRLGGVIPKERAEMIRALPLPGDE